MSSHTYSFEAIGTSWFIVLKDEVVSPKNLEKKILQRIASYDKNYSRFREDSLIFKMSEEKGTYTLPHDAKKMFDLYEKLYSLTNGHITPLIGNLMEEVGYDRQYSLVEGSPQKSPKWDEALRYKYPEIEIRKPVLIDVGAAGKGYLIDIVAGILEKEGVKEYMINAGGDIVYKGGKPLKVGLEHPSDEKKVIGVVELVRGSICSSAGNRRAWGKYHHIVDPHRLVSPKKILSVWVVAEEALLADALATSLFFVSPETLLSEFSFEYFMLTDTLEIEKSEHFPASLFD